MKGLAGYLVAASALAFGLGMGTASIAGYVGEITQNPRTQSKIYKKFNFLAGDFGENRVVFLQGDEGSYFPIYIMNNSKKKPVKEKFGLLEITLAD